jgi:hypothetical protein
MELVSHLHGQLLLGTPGSMVVEMAGAWGVIMILTAACSAAAWSAGEAPVRTAGVRSRSAMAMPVSSPLFPSLAMMPPRQRPLCIGAQGLHLIAGSLTTRWSVRFSAYM